MTLKSDRLKKLEAELNDLEQWLKLGLVPKRDIEKHKGEIESIRSKIEEEKDRLRFLKESGELEEYVTPRKQQARAQYTEMPSLPDIDIAEDSSAFAEVSEIESDSLFDTSMEAEGGSEEEESKEESSEDEDPYSDRNRWRRGMLRPDEDEW